MSPTKTRAPDLLWTGRLSKAQSLWLFCVPLIQIHTLPNLLYDCFSPQQTPASFSRSQESIRSRWKFILANFICSPKTTAAICLRSPGRPKCRERPGFFFFPLRGVCAKLKTLNPAVHPWKQNDLGANLVATQLNYRCRLIYGPVCVKLSQ